MSAVLAFNVVSDGCKRLRPPFRGFLWRACLSLDIKYVSGSVEAACGLGLADGVVDLVETGTTMKVQRTTTEHNTLSILVFLGGLLGVVLVRR